MRFGGGFFLRWFVRFSVCLRWRFFVMDIGFSRSIFAEVFPLAIGLCLFLRLQLVFVWRTIRLPFGWFNLALLETWSFTNERLAGNIRTGLARLMSFYRSQCGRSRVPVVGRGELVPIV